MTMILDVRALPRAQESRTRRLNDAFFDEVRANFPALTVKTLDLAHEHMALPAIDSWDISAKFEVAYGEGHLTEEQAERWNRIIQCTDQLHACSLVVISAPMWNFSVPWHLKRWIDCVVQAQLTFEVSQSGYAGLLTGRPAVVLTTRDGHYGKGSPLDGCDFFLPYVTRVLELMGLGPVHTVVAEGLVDASEREAALRLAAERSRDLARTVCQAL